MTRMLAERPGRGIWLSPLISGSAIVAPTPPVSVLLCSPASDRLRGVCSECRIQKRWHLEAIAQSTSLGALDSSLRADEQTSMQVRLRCHPRLGPALGHPRRVEYESAHRGALQSLASGLDNRVSTLGQQEPWEGLEPYGHVVIQVRSQEPCRSAERVCVEIYPHQVGGAAQTSRSPWDHAGSMASHTKTS